MNTNNPLEGIEGTTDDADKTDKDRGDPTFATLWRGTPTLDSPRGPSTVEGRRLPALRTTAGRQGCPGWGTD